MQLTNNLDEQESYRLHRRFDRFARLVGDEVMLALKNTKVMIIGLGGVGSWAAESLVRSGVGHIVLMDFDEICITNTNRQLHTLTGLIGQKKSEVMSARLKSINPQLRVTSYAEFYSKENHSRIENEKPDYIIEAIDNLTAKSYLLYRARQDGLKLIACGGAAGRLDLENIFIKDLSETTQDQMLAQVRKILRQDYDFPKEDLFNIPCVFSTEPALLPKSLKYDQGSGFQCICPQGQNGMHQCDRRAVIYGSASFVTANFGLRQAAWVVREVTKKFGG